MRYYHNISEYKENASFKNGECNYIVDWYSNYSLYLYLVKRLDKGKTSITKKNIDKRVSNSRKITYVTSEGKFVEVNALEFKKETQIAKTEPSQTTDIKIFKKVTTELAGGQGRRFYGYTWKGYVV